MSRKRTHAMGFVCAMILMSSCVGSVDSTESDSSGVTLSNGTVCGTAKQGGTITLATNNPQTWNGAIRYMGTNTLNLGTGAVTPSGDRTLTVNGGNLTVGGVIGTMPSTIVPASLGVLFTIASTVPAQCAAKLVDAMYAVPLGMLLDTFILLLWRELPGPLSRFLHCLVRRNTCDGQTGKLGRKCDCRRRGWRCSGRCCGAGG